MISENESKQRLSELVRFTAREVGERGTLSCDSAKWSTLRSPKRGPKRMHIQLGIARGIATASDGAARRKRRKCYSGDSMGRPKHPLSADANCNANH